MPGPTNEIFLFIVVGLFAADKVVSWLKNRGIDLPRLTKQVEDLHVCHNVKDTDGVPIWYSRKSLEHAIARLADNIEKQTEILRAIHDEQRDLSLRVRMKMEDTQLGIKPPSP